MDVVDFRRMDEFMMTLAQEAHAAVYMLEKH